MEDGIASPGFILFRFPFEFGVLLVRLIARTTQTLVGVACHVIWKTGFYKRKNTKNDKEV